MSNDSDEGFHLFDGLEHTLDPDTVDQLVGAQAGNKQPWLVEALRQLDKMSEEMVPGDSLAAAIDEVSWAEFAECAFALDVLPQKYRLRSVVARAWRRAWAFADDTARVVDERGYRRQALDNYRAILEHHKDVLSLVSKESAATLSDLELQYRKAVAAEVQLANAQSRGPAFAAGSRGIDILGDAEIYGLNDQQVDALFDMIDERVVLNEEGAVKYLDDEEIMRVRELLRWEPAPLGSVSMDITDYYILCLTEAYAFCFGKKVSFSYDASRAESSGVGHYVRFLRAAASVCSLPITNWEWRLKHWRNLPGIKARLAGLTELGCAARAGHPLPFLLDPHRHLITLELSSAGAHVWDDAG